MQSPPRHPRSISLTVTSVIFYLLASPLQLTAAQDATFREIAASPDGHHFYVVASTDQPFLSVYRRTASGLELLQTVSSGDCSSVPDEIEGASAIVVHRDGSALYVAAQGRSGRGRIAVFRRATDPEGPDFGKIELQQVVTDNDASLHGMRASLQEARSLTTSSDSKWLLVGAAPADVSNEATAPAGGFPHPERLLQFEINRNKEITFRRSVPLEAGNDDQSGSAVAVALSPDGSNAYLADAASDAIIALRINRTSGEFEQQQAITTASAGDSLDSPNQIAVSHDGRFVYVASRGGHVSWFARQLSGDDGRELLPTDPKRGRLSFLGSRRTDVATRGLGVARTNSLALSSPPGNFLYAAAGGRSSGAILVYGRDPEGGGLSAEAKQIITGGSSATAIVLGEQVQGAEPIATELFAIGLLTHSINRYRRDDNTGSIELAPPGVGLPSPLPYCITRPETVTRAEPIGPAKTTVIAVPTPSVPGALPTTVIVEPSPTRAAKGTTHDSATVFHSSETIDMSGRDAKTQEMRVSVSNRDFGEREGHAIQLIASDGDCPRGIVDGTADFPGPDGDTTNVPGGGSRSATVRLTVIRSQFPTLPATCNLEMTVRCGAPPGCVDPTPGNNSMQVVLHVRP